MRYHSFAKRFRSHSNAQLLEVLRNRDNYQHEAILAAQAELNMRELDAATLAAAEQELNHFEQQQLQQKEKREALRRKVRAAVTKIPNKALRFLQSLRSKGDVGIFIVSIVFALEFLWQLSLQWGILGFMFTDAEALWDVTMAGIFLPVILLPPAVVLFFLRKKTGWFLLTFHISFSLATVIAGILITELLFHRTFLPLSFQIAGVLFYGTPLYYVCTGKIRKRFSVGLQPFVWTLIIASATACYLWWVLLDQ